MLRHGKGLATWQLAQPPIELPVGATRPARKLPDHREAYLTFEGPVSGNRGRVNRLDDGTYELLESRDDRWEFILSGRIVSGRFELVPLPAPSIEGDWILRRLA